MSSGSTVAIVASAISNAIKASGVVVEVPAEDFLTIVRRTEGALVIHTRTKVIRTKHKYLTSYKGFAFYTVVPEPLRFDTEVEVVEAKKMWIPEM